MDIHLLVICLCVYPSLIFAQCNAARGEQPCGKSCYRPIDGDLCCPSPGALVTRVYSAWELVMKGCSACDCCGLSLIEWDPIGYTPASYSLLGQCCNGDTPIYSPNVFPNNRFVCCGTRGYWEYPFNGPACCGNQLREAATTRCCPDQSTVVGSNDLCPGETPPPTPAPPTQPPTPPPPDTAPPTRQPTVLVDPSNPPVMQPTTAAPTTPRPTESPIRFIPFVPTMRPPTVSPPSPTPMPSGGGDECVRYQQLCVELCGSLQDVSVCECDTRTVRCGDDPAPPDETSSDDSWRSTSIASEAGLDTATLLLIVCGIACLLIVVITLVFVILSRRRARREAARGASDVSASARASRRSTRRQLSARRLSSSSQMRRMPSARAYAGVPYASAPAVAGGGATTFGTSPYAVTMRTFQSGDTAVPSHPQHAYAHLYGVNTSAAGRGDYAEMNVARPAQYDENGGAYAALNMHGQYSGASYGSGSAAGSAYSTMFANM